MSTRPRTFNQRSERKPLYVQVLTEPGIRGCWSVNLSDTGIGLVASPSTAEEGPKEGQEVALEFTLPAARTRVRAHGIVRWRHDARELKEGATTAMGVQFLRFEGSDGVKVARFLRDHRVKVVVAYADRTAAERLRAALRDEVELLFVASDEEVELALGRGDISAFVVHGTREGRAEAVLEQVLALTDDPSLSRWRPREIAPTLVFWAPARAERLVALFNGGRLHRALSPNATTEELREAILDACRVHGMRIEQRRMALELERHLIRERARAGARPTATAEGPSPGFTSAAMQRVAELVDVVAPHRVAVLLQGETGTGKEVLARRVHRRSSRSAAAFVVQDCGALPETLLESELFGHVKGAFTGAVADHPGLFVLADGGTIFLDEIENTTPNLQARLLRAIETGEIRPVGGTAVRQVDVRVIAASNKPLEEEVRHGRFRSDLFYRLNTFVIDVPPLRQRPDDILPLARHFLQSYNEALGRSATGFTPEAAALLLRLDWPGNVRELRNVVERAVLLSAPNQPITPAHFPDALVARAARAPGAMGHRRSFDERMAEAERQILREALHRADGVLRRAAQELLMDPVTLGRRARRLGLWPLTTRSA
ncbi:MAG: sigma 54-interacting transcriptional regulator [Myxococcaceae bacterium]|nr:sigma 54-interacting transcriptional regulator [Myxococcaceae bacterium]